SEIWIAAPSRQCAENGASVPLWCCNRNGSGWTSSTAADGGGGVQERSNPERHSRRRIHGHHGNVCGCDQPELHELSCVGQYEYVGQICPRHTAEANSASHDEHGQHHQ